VQQRLQPRLLGRIVSLDTQRWRWLSHKCGRVCASSKRRNKGQSMDTDSARPNIEIEFWNQSDT
jgi:hypothetical protein